jgi:ComF family protein
VTRDLPRRLLAAAVDLVWPRRCASCGHRLAAGAREPLARVFCVTCSETLVRAGSPRCPSCGTSYDAGAVDHRCGLCLDHPPPFESARAPFLYGGALADAISRLKYSAATWLAAPLGSLLIDVELSAAPDAIVPVPLHPRRLIERGFNQSALLATALANRLDLRLDTTALVRVEDTPPQARQSRSERLTALRGAFAIRVPRRVEGARVLLVDDVVTTTATVRAASESLLQAGAAAVDVVALSRAEWTARVAGDGQTG